MVTPLPGIKRSQIDTSLRSIWRYSAALPAKINNPVSLGEVSLLNPSHAVEGETRDGTPNYAEAFRRSTSI